MTEERKTTVLIADDEIWYAEPVKDALESDGYKVILEPNMTGSRVLEIMRDPNFQIDILILDIMMDPGPELDNEVIDGTKTGVSIYNRIRKEMKKNSPDFPIICLTVIKDDDSTLDPMKSDRNCKILSKVYAGIDDILKAIKILK